jgi:hypothetical protein
MIDQSEKQSFYFSSSYWAHTHTHTSIIHPSIHSFIHSFIHRWWCVCGCLLVHFGPTYNRGSFNWNTLVPTKWGQVVHSKRGISQTTQTTQVHNDVVETTLTNPIQIQSSKTLQNPKLFPTTYICSEQNVNRSKSIFSQSILPMWGNVQVQSPNECCWAAAHQLLNPPSGRP